MHGESSADFHNREGVFYERSMHPRAAGGRIRVHLALFLATMYTTTVAGASLANALPVLESTFPGPESVFGNFLWLIMAIVHPHLMAIAHPHLLVAGLPFSITLLLILFVHEMGHYLSSRRWHVRATLPYFIPLPLMIGTLGAVIRIKSRIPNTRALLDIGASGPIAGFVMSVMALAIGLPMSETIRVEDVAPGSLTLGDSYITTWMGWLMIGDLPAGMDVMLHPVALAGWLGLFVTMLNLLPVGQFDGGHVVYALLGGRAHELFSRFTIVFLALFWALGPPYDWVLRLDLSAWLATRWPGWLVWIAIAVVLGRRHPPPFDSRESLNAGRIAVGLVSLIILAVCFIPRPFSISF